MSEENKSEELDKLVKTSMHIGFREGRITGVYLGILMSLSLYIVFRIFFSR